MDSEGSFIRVLIDPVDQHAVIDLNQCALAGIIDYHVHPEVLAVRLLAIQPHCYVV